MEDDGEGLSSKTSEAFLFAEEEEAFRCIEQLSGNNSITARDAALERLRIILDKYLECPTLLDQSLESMVQKLSGSVREKLLVLQKPDLGEIQHSLSTLYALSKVRGRKCIQRFLPHNVDDVEAVWRGLQATLQTKNEFSSSDNDSFLSSSSPPLWESVYVLWNWMAALSKVPFDCTVLAQESLIQELLLACRSALQDAGPTREVAAVCLACWLSRPDLEPQITSFVQWSQGILQDYLNSNKSSDLFCVLGILQTVTAILKVSSIPRDRLIAQMSPLWQTLSLLSSNTENLLLRKLLVKWWTRMSCAYLPPRVAAWRYQRGKRSLLDNLCNDASDADKTKALVAFDETKGKTNLEEQKRELFPVPDEVEDAMGWIIESLSHSSTIVRWSAAKGIGRITERLPVLCVEDVLDAVLELFEDPEKDRCWHGACLALAELARRGLLLPSRLGTVVPYIVRAVHYDCRRGHSSVGAHVRDAACYTYWAFARAYSPMILRPYLSDLSESIVLTCLFDREVNCRRAASAAFQEAVGRQGATNFPHGIEILTTADYFSLGNRTDAYLSIAWKIAEFEEYRRPIVRHLYTSKLFHWDSNIRALVSRSLGGLVCLDAAFLCSIVIPNLLERCLDEKDLYTRHGAVLGVAEITLALAESTQIDLLSPSSVETLTALVPAIEKKRLYRGRGGEIMRSAVCRLIECLSIAELPLTVKQQVRLLDSIDANIPHPTERTQQEACRALKALMGHYFPVGMKGPSDRLQKRVVDNFIEKAGSSKNPAVTRGYTLAFGYLPAKLLAPSKCVLESIIFCLRKTAERSALVGDERDAETRRNSLLSLIKIYETIGFVSCTENSAPVVSLDSDMASVLFSVFCSSMDDYNIDRRGDVGSWCRIAGMDGVTGLVLMAAADIRSTASLESFYNESTIILVVSALMKQLSEKLDVVRERAGACLERIILSQDPPIPLPGKTDLIQALGLAEGTKLKRHWSDPSRVFPKVLKVASLHGKFYFDSVIAGIVTSIGALTEDVSKHASASLLQWAKQGTPEQREQLGYCLLKLLEKHSSDGRVVLPVLKTLDLLFSHRLLNKIVQSKDLFSGQCLQALQREAGCKDIPRLFAIVDVTADLLISSPGDDTVRRRALAFMCTMLTHGFPRVRSYSAEQFYLYLLESDSEKRERAVDLLLKTTWASENSNIQRNEAAKVAESLNILEEFRCRDAIFS